MRTVRNRVWSWIAIAVGVIVASWLFVSWYNDPTRVLDRMLARVQAAARDAQEQLPAMLEHGPATEVVAPGALLSRIVYAWEGTRVDIDAGPGRTVGVHKIVMYRDRDGLPGRISPPDVVGASFSSKPASTGGGDRTTFLQATDGFGARRPVHDRPFAEISATALRGEDQVDERRVVVIGPGIELGSAADEKWKLLLHVPGAWTVDWREVGQRLELRVVDVGGDIAGVTVDLGGGAAPVAKGDRTFLGSVPVESFEAGTRLLRSVVRVVERGPDPVRSVLEWTLRPAQ